MRSSRLLLTLVMLFFFLYGSIMAGTTGKIVGTVTDKNSNEPLVGANVTLDGTTLGAATDQDGYFMIINIPPGTYDLKVYYVGYVTTTVENVKINVDRTTRQNIQVTEETMTGETIVVEAERPIIEKDRTFSASIVNSESIEDMPVTEISEVISLQAGVVTGAGNEIHFRGGREREVAYLIDGVPVTDAFSQGGGSNVDIENSVIEELQVISGTFNAEYGSAQSGIVNVITKGVEQKYKGSVRMYTGEWISNKDDIFIGINDVNPLATKDVQATFSGPLLSDKLGFFVSSRYSNNESYEWYERRYNPIDGWKINAYNRWYGEHYAGQLTQGGRITIPDSLKTGDGERGPLYQRESLSFNAKLSYLPTATLKLTYQLFGSWDQSKGGNEFNRYQPDETATWTGNSQHHFLIFKHSPTAYFFYNLRASFQHNISDSYYRKDNKIAEFPGDTGIHPIGSSSSGFSLGNTAGFYTGKEGKNYRDLYMVNGDLNWQVDKYNFIKAGFEIKQHEVNTYDWGYIETQDWQRNKYSPSINGRDYTWPEYWDTMVNYWENWNENFGTTKYRKLDEDEITLYRDYTIRPFEAAFYIQDKLELGDIILNGGVRLDMFDPKEKVVKNKRVESYLLGTDSNLEDAKTQYQVSPRFGISFPISATGAFHVAYGHFFQMPSFSKMYNQPLYTMTPLQLEDRRLGNAELEPERTVAYEIGIQQGVTHDLSLTCTAYYKDIENLLGIEKVTTVDAIGYTRYINRDYGTVKGVTVALTKAPTGLISGSVDYTLQYSNGSASNPDFLQLVETATRVGGTEQQFIERQILPLDWDQRHTVNAILNISRPRDWIFSVLSSWGSGLPYTPEFVESFEMPEREFKNTARKPIRWSVDIKAKKFLELMNMRYILFLKVDNLFDHLNENYVYATSGRASNNARIPSQEAIERSALAQEGHFTLDEVDNRPEWYSEPRKIELGLEILF